MNKQGEKAEALQSDAAAGRVADDGDGVSRDCKRTLADAAIGEPLIVSDVIAPANAPEWARWLEEIGFVADEPAMLLACFVPGGDPLVVRIGVSTFALRRAEAACVRVAPSSSRARA
ncbi:MAG TPA: FeoA family protein [Burkholderiales bacterium]|nr:FeoA family protein [Burkholderiales bacterium]